MKRIICLLIAVLLANIATTKAAEPLRVFIRAGAKTHGPGQHDHPRFLREWTQLLNERGAKADGAMEFPQPAQLEKTDVLILHCQDAMKIVGEDRVARNPPFMLCHPSVETGNKDPQYHGLVYQSFQLYRGKIWDTVFSVESSVTASKT